MMFFVKTRKTQISDFKVSVYLQNVVIKISANLFKQGKLWNIVLMIEAIGEKNSGRCIGK